MKIIDTHTHYDDGKFADFDFAAPDFADKVEKFIAIGCTLERSRAAVAIARRHGTKATVGIHPCDAAGLPDDYIARLRELAEGNSGIVAAVGEIGLDYYYDTFENGDRLDRDLQLRVLREQLDLAVSLKLPVVYHLRASRGSSDALAAALPIITEVMPRLPAAVVHCFSGSASYAAELVRAGFYISFTGNVTYKAVAAGNTVKEAVAAVPLERLMLETDCPYLSPVPFRGKLCHSGMLSYTAAAVAEIKGVDTVTVVDVCNANARTFFGI